jgi:hypothetical protein
VLGSATAIFFAIYLGLRETLLVGGVLYLLALCILRLSPGPDTRSGAITGERIPVSL